jgi:CheY-like chemotaxis protein
MTMSNAVLVVDDEDDVREALAALIERWGFEVVTAGSGREALETLPRLRPRLVLLDLTMPDINGWSVRAAMLADPSLASIPVVLLSGVADAPLQSKVLQTEDLLTKPIDVEKLRELLSAHLGRPAPR